MSKRAAIVGTAGTWVQTPWDDLGLEICSLNDAYMCRDARGQGIQRINRWYELHPIDRMWFRPKEQRTVYAHDVPAGHYVRPDGHLEWLQTQAKTIPVFLKDAPPVEWPANAHRFPIETVAETFGHDYWSSGPQYMFAQLLLEGYTEIHVYGIHLATQAEYIEQRPGWEHILGRAMGLKYRVEEQKDLRIYHCANGFTLVLPKACPILTHGWRYAYEPKPVPAVPESLAQARKDIKEIRAEKSSLTAKLVTYPRWKSKAKELERLEYLALVEADIAQQISRHHAQSAVIALGG